MTPLIFFTILFILASLLSLLKPTKTKKISPPPSKDGTTKSSKEDGDQLKTIFATFDTDGDGFITLEELEHSLRRLNISVTSEEVKSMMERVDANGDGLIDGDEFRNLCESLETSTTTNSAGEQGDEELELREVFEVFDGNGDGVITREELGSVLTSMGLKQGVKIEDCDDMIRRVDLDGDGKVDFEEFKRMMMAKGGKLF